MVRAYPSSAHRSRRRIRAKDHDVPDKVKEKAETLQDDRDMDESKAWAIAWSIYCKHVNPGSDHCKKDEYFEGRDSCARCGRTLRRVASEPGAGEDPLDLVRRLKTYLHQLDYYLDTTRDLIDAGESRRLQRVDEVSVLEHEWTGVDGGVVEATIEGSTGNHYNTRLNLGDRGHFCTCLDWQQRGMEVGPCKHVLRLARFWLAFLLDEQSTMREQLITTLSRTQL